MKNYITSVNKTCKLKLNISSVVVNKIFEYLQNNVEVAGYFQCDDQDNIINVRQQDGDSSSVYTPNNVINYHTHPIKAYIEADCVWGWPSGEDIRESIKFGMAGNKAHLVFTNEGLYTIQVSPCKLIKLKNMTDIERCILIFSIEEYFKSTHEFRCTDEVTDLSERNIFINPYSFIDFANNFNLSNLSKTVNRTYTNLPLIPITKVGHTGIHSFENGNIQRYSGNSDVSFTKIPTDGFPYVSGKKICTKQFAKVIRKDDLEDLRGINCSGQEKDFVQFKGVKDFETKLNTIIRKYNEQPCNIEWNNDKNPDAWFYINFFPSNKFKFNTFKKGKKFIKPSQDPVYLESEPFIRIFSNEKTGCSVNKIKQTSNFT